MQEEAVKQKIVFIIPGYRQQVTNKSYKQIAEILKNEDYLPVLIDISWKNTTISQNTEYFLGIYKRYHAQETYVLGFSYGAMIAFISATKVPFSGVLLCSLSPYFSEDLPKRRKALSALMNARHKDFMNYNAQMLAKELKTEKIHMFYGTQESKALIRRVKNTFNQIPQSNKQLISISKTEHEIGSCNYLTKIHQISKTLY